MTTSGSNENALMFGSPEESLGSIDTGFATQLIAAASDLALVVDEQGQIKDVMARSLRAPVVAQRGWVGHSFEDTVAPDSKEKVRALLQEVEEGAPVRSREINHRLGPGQDLPIRYTALSLGHEGRVLALGRDLSELSELQQQLVGAQQSMEREYARLRHAETRYRLLFQIASEAVLIVDASNLKIAEANPAAGTLLEETPRRMAGRTLTSLFADEAWPTVEQLLSAVRVTGWAEDTRARLAGGNEDVVLSVSLFRQDSVSLFLVRLSPTEQARQPEPGAVTSKLIEVVQRLPDAFVVVDVHRRVLTLNATFLDLVQLATDQQVRRESLDTWLGREGGSDMSILMATLKEHGSVRNFATVIRGQFGSVEEVEVSGVAAMNGDEPCYGFMLRPVASRLAMERDVPKMPRSVEQLTGLVGRVPLKEIVRETTDVIERLCIEAALEVSRDNRANAAQVLGLSRQSLYAKLRRHGLGDLDGGNE